MQEKSYKERYFQDYHIEKKFTKNGKRSRTVYVYHGAWCRWTQYDVPLEANERKTRKILYAVLLLSEVLFFAIAAFWRSPVNTAAGVAVAGCLSLVPLLYQLLYGIRFCLAGPKMKQIDAEDIHKYIRYASACHALLLILAAIMGTVTVLQVSASVSPLLFYLLSAGCSASLFLLQRRMEPSIIPET